MTVRITTTCLVLFAGAHLGVGQDSRKTPPQTSPIQVAPSESSHDSLPKAILRIQRELKQIAEDINTVNARMLRESGNGSNQTVSMATNIHELLKKEDPATLIRDFSQASQDRLRFEACLKSAKLYRNLAAAIFATRKTRTSENGQSAGQLDKSDAFAQAAQILFLSRMIPALGLQYGEMQSQAQPTPEAGRVELWHSLREALRRDDEVFLGRLIGFIAAAGESPHQFAAKILSQAQKTSQSAAATIVESLAIVSPSRDVWNLASVPGINPEFLNALECEQRALDSIPMEGSPAAILHAINCRRSANGSSVQAFAESQTRPAQSIATSSKTTLPGRNEASHSTDIFRLPTEKELRDLQSQNSTTDTAPTAPGQLPAFGVSNTPVKRPKIPSWWIRCACPSDHPDAGIVFEGIRWHAPVLQCPNPELRGLEVK
jgi:hypothetical protein